MDDRLPTDLEQAAIDRFLDSAAKRWRIGQIKPFSDVRMTRASLADLIEVRAILYRMLGNNREAEISWLEYHGGIPVDAASIQASKNQLFQFLTL